MATYTHTKVDYINVLSSGPRYWVASVSENFSSNNWSLTSGGSPGASVPVSGNSVIFDNGGQGSCIVDTSVSVLSITQNFNYIGTFSQESYPIITGDANFLGGSFIGTNFPVSVYGNLTFSEGFSWQGSDSTISAFGNVYANYGFTADQGRALVFLGTNKQNLYCNGGILSTVHIDKTSSNQVKAFGDYPIYVNGDFIIFDGTFNTNGHDLSLIVEYIPPPLPTTTTTTTPAPYGNEEIFFENGEIFFPEGEIVL